ncbi:hypothetical protein ACFQVA_38355 [Actinomadura keratinilytica]
MLEAEGAELGDGRDLVDGMDGGEAAMGTPSASGGTVQCGRR